MKNKAVLKLTMNENDEIHGDIEGGALELLTLFAGAAEKLILNQDDVECAQLIKDSIIKLVSGVKING